MFGLCVCASADPLLSAFHHDQRCGHGDVLYDRLLLFPGEWGGVVHIEVRVVVCVNGCDVSRRQWEHLNKVSAVLIMLLWFRMGPMWEGLCHGS